MNRLSKYLIVILIISLSSNISAQEKISRAKILFEQKKYDEAKMNLEEIIDTNENNHEAFFYLGKIYMIEKDYEEAADYFEEAVELQDENADYHFALGQAYGADAQESNPISQAFLAPKIRDEFARAVKLNPEHLGGNIGLANFHLNAPGIVGGDLEEAYKAGQRILELDEKRGRLVLINYFSISEKFDSVDSQISLLENKFGEDKAISSIYNSYGYTLLGLNKFEEALVYFKKQVKVAPNNPNSYDSLGDGYRAIGNLEQAKNQYQKALEIDPSFEPSIENLEEVLEELDDLD